MKLLNIGCGLTFHPDWDNLDLVAQAAGVIETDLTQGLPYPDSSADATYSSHVLEHLRPAEADAFIAEQFRVLKPGAPIRIVVPDLEAICREYLTRLEQAAARPDDPKARFRHHYSKLELIDQLVREKSGGAFLPLWLSGEIPDLDHVVTRHGEEATRIIHRDRHPAPPPSARRPLLRKLSRSLAKRRRKLILALLGRQTAAAVKEGLFRSSGEIHREMYDHHSLHLLLTRHGFVQATRQSATSSFIPDFASYQLDAVDGRERKPDSIFYEATKPV